MNEEKLSDMVACFLQCDKPDLVEYLQELIMIIRDHETYDDEISDEEYEEEAFEVVKDENGFLSLK